MQCILLAALILWAVVFTCESAVGGEGGDMYVCMYGQDFYLFLILLSFSDNGCLDLGIERWESCVCNECFCLQECGPRWVYPVVC